MIDKDTLLETTTYEHPYQKEKDYIEELFLTEIYSATDALIFKGGTAISKFYGSARFSDDLDFSIALNYANKNSVSMQVATIVSKLSKECPLKIMRKRNDRNMLVYELSVRGPLFEMLNKYQHLKIEIDKNASLISRVNIFRRNPPYPDLKPYTAMVMSTREIMAEKVVALLFRHNMKTRDLYDIYFLMQSGVDVDVNMVDKKMKEHGHVFSEPRLISRMEEFGGVWEKELRRLLPESKFVGFGSVKKYVMRRFEDSDLM